MLPLTAATATAVLLPPLRQSCHCCWRQWHLCRFHQQQWRWLIMSVEMAVILGGGSGHR